MSEAVPIEKCAGELYEAFASAQGEFPVIPKDSEVIVYSKDAPKRELYRYKYADLTTIIAHTRPAMIKHGLSFTQGMITGGFHTLLMHKSGLTMSTGFVPCEISKTMDAKVVAGIFTYMKRISLSAALGISADEDVDAAANEGIQGNSTSKGPVAKAVTTNPPIDPPPPLGPTPAMLKRLYAIGNGVGWKPKAIRIYSLAKVKRTPGKLSKPQYDKLCTMLAGAPYDEQQSEEIKAMYEGLTEQEKAQVDGSVES